MATPISPMDTSPIVGGVPISTIIVLFLLYVVIHVAIGYIYKQKEKKLQSSAHDPGTEEFKRLQDELKIWKQVFRWFPAAWVIIILITL